MLKKRLNLRLGGVEEHKAPTETGAKQDEAVNQAVSEPASANRLVSSSIDDQIQDNSVQLRKQPTTVIEEDHNVSVEQTEHNDNNK